MVEHLDEVFGALADPTRRDILAQLALGEATVTEIARRYPVSLNAISKHLMVLEGAGLVARHVEGRTHLMRLEAEPLRNAQRWLEMYRGFWESRLDALEEFLAINRKQKKGVRRARRR
jgi:DNA-binding transcriptional ArsR family regulator